MATTRQKRKPKATKASVAAQSEPRPHGQPTGYKPEYCTQARKLAELGATDADLGEAFGVTARTIINWQIAHEEFRAALKLGKEAADDLAERSLYTRVRGYEYDAVKIFMPAGSDKPVYAPYKEHVPPDPWSCFVWLKNRRKEDWRDKIDHEHSGRNGEPIKTLNTTMTLQDWASLYARTVADPDRSDLPLLRSMLTDKTEN